MNLLEPRGPLWTKVYLGLLLFNGLVAITCLVAGPRRWARWLCAIASQVNILLLFGFMAAGKSGAPEEFGIGFGWFLGLFLPVLGEFLALLAISRWRLRDPSFPWVPN